MNHMQNDTMNSQNPEAADPLKHGITYGIYVVDDEPLIRDGIRMALQDDYRLNVFSDAESALDAMQTDTPPDLVLLDVGLPGMNGIEALKIIKKRKPEILVIMITAYEDIETVIAAMKTGAHDYVVKPLHMDGLEVTIHNALDTIRLRKEVQALQERCLRENAPFFIGESNAIQSVMDVVKKVAASPDTPILITGETGTGKELIASAIHYYSPRFNGPFATVNCAAISKDIIESELFGYEKGAFSGAAAGGKKGLVEAAEGGTLFLDEVGDLSPDAQAKLLRFLELGEFYRVGGTAKRFVRTRVVAATNKHLDHMIAEGHFRKDLYFRLSVINIQLPALNERREDILPLANFFLQEFSRRLGKPVPSLSPPAESALREHTWTGHIRELRNVIERAVIVGNADVVAVEDLGLVSAPETDTGGHMPNQTALPPLTSEGIDLPRHLQCIERRYIQNALALSDGNESRAARLLNMNHHTFRYRRKKVLG